MEQKIVVINRVRGFEGGDAIVVPNEPGVAVTGIPAGGSVRGTGIAIDWQDGALGRDEARVEPNGAFVEGVIQAAASRLEFYQASKFYCVENATALACLYSALDSLKRRTQKREARAVEGTHEV